MLPGALSPNAPEVDPGQVGGIPGNFCGAESIALDNPKVEDKLALGVQCYNCVAGTNSPGGPIKAGHPRVNVYCDGELVTGFGYDPSLSAGVAQYPQLLTEGQSSFGAMWMVGVLEWIGPQPGGAPPCKVSGTGEGKIAAWDKDAWHAQANGSAAICVLNGPLDAGGRAFDPPASSASSWPFRLDGSYPANAGQLCSYAEESRAMP